MDQLQHLLEQQHLPKLLVRYLWQYIVMKISGYALHQNHHRADNKLQKEMDQLSMGRILNINAFFVFYTSPFCWWLMFWVSSLSYTNLLGTKRLFLLLYCQFTGSDLFYSRSTRTRTITSSKCARFSTVSVITPSPITLAKCLQEQQ